MESDESDLTKPQTQQCSNRGKLPRGGVQQVGRQQGCKSAELDGEPPTNTSASAAHPPGIQVTICPTE
eukprot:CAMPEP_0169173692 /NCGR_PEP_ID=MMETSP1015-20121227/64063_1 /TAXON_ID=342587 /ORGANISM="Karlodinium micrum, Strain CCMP2283" /LENGTH=67 /DNA_ID=CAMNT_0009247331 /DNA_START=964 /DNA_END=1167 /DNA_ORIENTATION=-